MNEKLANTFGEDFAENYQKKVQQRQQSRNQLSDEDKAIVADKAVNQGALDDGDPMFDYTDTNGVAHRVMLMQFPDLENGTVYSYANELSTGAVSIPFDYLGDWVSCLFNGGKEAVAEFEEGDMYLMVGQHGTWENDSGEENDQLSPVTAAMTLDEVNQLADKGLEAQGFSSESEEDTSGPVEEEVVEDTAEEDLSAMEDEAEEAMEAEEEDEDDDDDDGFLGGGDDDDEEEEDTEGEYEGFDPEQIKDSVESLATKDERVWDAERDSAWSEKIANVIVNGTEYEDAEKVEELAMTYIVDGEDALFALFEDEEEEASDDSDDDDEDELLF